MPDETATSTRIALRDATLRDLLRTVGIPPHPPLLQLTEWLGGRPLCRFLDTVAAFDRDVAKHSLKPASTTCCNRLNTSPDLPDFPTRFRHGPLLITANHPGLTDTITLFAAIERSDLIILAEPNPFLLALRHVSDRILFLPPDLHARGRALRPLLRHLRDGGAVLTFPAGRIEPDPRWFAEGAVHSLASWSESVTLLARRIPDMTVLPALVSGVFHQRALRHPLTRLGRTSNDREMIAAYVQILGGERYGVQPRVRWGEAVMGGTSFSMDRIRQEMERLIQSE